MFVDGEQPKEVNIMIMGGSLSLSGGPGGVQMDLTFLLFELAPLLRTAVKPLEYQV